MNAFTLPAGYSVRPPTLADVSATVAMFNAVAMELLGTPQFTEEEFAADWQEPGFELSTDARIILDRAGQVVASVDVVSPAPHVRNFLWGRVHPTARGRGLGTYLLQWAEARLRERLDDAPAGARITADCQIVADHQPAVDLLHDLGYQHIRSFYMMKTELTTTPPTPVWPAGLSLRTMRPGHDEEALYRATVDSFRDHWGFVEVPFEEGFELWQHSWQSKSDHDPTLFFLVVRQAERPAEEIVGYAMCDPQITDDPEMAWIRSLGVRRPWRRRGVALALLRHAFGEFHRRGIYKVGLGVDADNLTGALRLYERAGMYPIRQYNTYQKELRPGRDLTAQ